MAPSVYIVAQEQVGRLRWKAPVFKESQKIVVLAMDVATDADGRGDFNKHRLLDEDVLDDADNTQHFLLLQFD